MINGLITPERERALFVRSTSEIALPDLSAPPAAPAPAPSAAAIAFLPFLPFFSAIYAQIEIDTGCSKTLQQFESGVPKV